MSYNSYLGLILPSINKGKANGVASLDENGKVPSSQLPSYVDDVVEYDTINDFPLQGESGKIYLDKSTSKIYRWGGSKYIAIGSDGGTSSMIEVTYADLVALRNNSELIPGQQYRIVDYVCTTSQVRTEVEQHPFDIIVVADDVSVLNENARAAVHADESTAEYYANCDLSAWELKYCLDNDTNRFRWAGEGEGGKGVIYWMKDDFGNECPYDFKQIVFPRYKVVRTSIEAFEGKWVACREDGTPINDVITEVDPSPHNFYTFSQVTEDGDEYRIEDASITPNAEGSGCITMNNKIGIYTEQKDPEYDYYNEVLVLSNNVFVNNIYSVCNGNVIGDNCKENTFNDACSYNTLIGDAKIRSSNQNLFNIGCDHNKIDGGSGNVFGESCSRNNLECDCNNNTFERISNGNTLGLYCGNIWVGEYCSYITFGKMCNDIKVNGEINEYHRFGNNCSGIVMGSQHYNCTILDGTQNVTIANGVGNQNYTTFIGKNSSGVLKTWVPADLIP